MRFNALFTARGREEHELNTPVRPLTDLLGEVITGFPFWLFWHPPKGSFYYSILAKCRYRKFALPLRISTAQAEELPEGIGLATPTRQCISYPPSPTKMSYNPARNLHLSPANAGTYATFSRGAESLYPLQPLI